MLRFTPFRTMILMRSTYPVLNTGLGSSPAGTLPPARVVVRQGFETVIQLPAPTGYVAVEALDAAGRTLARSSVLRVRPSILNQAVELVPHVLGRDGHVPAGPILAEQDEPELAAHRLLVALHRLPCPLAVDADRLGPEGLLHLADVPTGQAERGEEAERDRLPVGDSLVLRGRFEGMRERVAEVEDRALPPVVGVAEADGGLERGAAADHLVVRQLPERVAREQAGLHNLTHALPPLRLGQRLEERRVDHGERRPVEGPDEVLPLRQVEAGLAADGRVHLGDEARGDGDPGHSAEICRGCISRRVGRAAAAERDDRPPAVEPELLPQPVDGGERLRLLAGRELVRLREPLAERELRVHAVDACDVPVGDESDRAVAGDERAEPRQRATLDVDAARDEDDVVDVVRDDVGDLCVQAPPLLVQPAELRLVLGQRSVAAADALPARVDVDVEPHGERVAQRVPHRRRGDGPSAEREHDRLLLVPAERGLAVVLEDGCDRLSGRLLDEIVRVHHGQADRLRRRRLAGAHEADEGDALLQLIRPMYARHAATKSPSASPPNFSRAARASSHATAASATTASASTADTSLRSTSACAASPLSRSTDPSGRISVGNGFIAARTTISSPFDMPPSMPPARFDVLRLSVPISSCASDPRMPASAKPSPISTPFTAWIPMSAAASRASSRSSLRAYEPSPGGTPVARTSTTPPSVSRSLRAASIAASSTSAEPRTSTPISASSAFATAPAATCTAVCRAEARSSASRTSASPYFCTPARSAWPGRGSVTGFVPFPCGSPSGGHGAIPHVQFLWSRFLTTSASGVPSVRPCRRPASTSTSSVSICCRGERP